VLIQAHAGATGTLAARGPRWPRSGVAARGARRV